MLEITSELSEMSEMSCEETQRWGKTQSLILSDLQFTLSFSSISPHLIQFLLSRFPIAGYFASADTNPNPDPIKVSGKTSNNFNCIRTWLTVKKMLF